jgi:hypothetical protein
MNKLIMEINQITIPRGNEPEIVLLRRSAKEIDRLEGELESIRDRYKELYNNMEAIHELINDKTDICSDHQQPICESCHENNRDN